MAKILITGNAGFIGSSLTNALLDQGHEVIGIDDLSRGSIDKVDPRVDFNELSITDFDRIDELFEGVDYVYHLAALARVRPSIEDPIGYNEVNVTGTLNVLQLCVFHRVKKIIFASSSSVYGNGNPRFNELSKTNPKSPYALQKLIGEQYVRLYKDVYGLDYTILRYFNVYGPGQIIGGAYSTVIGIFLDQRDKGQSLTIFGDGSQRRDFTHIRDVTEANIKAMEYSGDFNIGRGNNKSVKEIADLISAKQTYLPPIPNEPPLTLADNGKAFEIMKWQPTIDVSPEIIKEMNESQSQF